MANDLNALAGKILSRGMNSLSRRAIMPRLVNLDHADAASQPGATIDVPVAFPVEAENVTPGPTPPAPPEGTMSVVQIQLNNWKKAAFYLTDKDMAEIDAREHFMPLQASEAIQALADAVNDSVHQEYKRVYTMIGTPGTTPFGANVGILTATEARRVLNEMRAPRSERRAVLDFDAEAQAIGLPQFSDAEKAGDANAKIEGEIGRKFGIDWYADDAVLTHVAGTASNAGAFTITNEGAADTGDTSVTLKSNTGAPTLVAGDIVKFAGHAQTYAVTAGVTLSTGGVEVSLFPALKADVADDEGVTVKGTHVVNLAFHRDAFALAMRPLAGMTEGVALGNIMQSITDPQTGVSLRLEVSRQYKQTVWEFDVLWGVKLVRPELALRIAG